MAKSQPKLLSFNGGVISPLAFARQDSPRIALCADEQTNWMPRRMGPMMLRTGTEHVAPIITKFTSGTLTVDVGGNKTLASSTGLANNATVYTANLSWGGFPPGGIAITVTGSAAQTYATLLAAIYTDISAASSLDEILAVYLDGGNIVFVDLQIGSDPEFVLTDGSPNALFATLSGTIGPNVPGETDIDSNSKMIPFVFSKADTSFFALVENQARVIVDDDYINPDSFGTTLRNGGFIYDLTNWTDADDAGCTSSHVAGSDSKGRLSLVGTGANYARRNQHFTVSGSDENTTFQFRVIIERGVVEISCGPTAGDDSYFSGTFGAGCHWISFEPADDFYLELASSTQYASLVDSVFFSSSGLQMDTDYTEDDFPLIRHAQSGNVVYLACEGLAPRKIERRSEFSYSFAEYLPDDGPFLKYNKTGITLVPSALSGDITLTASQRFFKSGHVGALFLIDSVGQKVSLGISAQNTFTDEIRVTGTTRSFFAIRSSIGTNTVTLQRSIGAPGSWVDVATYTTNATSTFNDSLDNEIAYYRIGIKTGDYVSGTTTVTLEYSQGSIAGICRVVSRTSSTVATAIVLRNFGGTLATTNWREGAWSDYRGYPSAVCLCEGRLIWGGKLTIWGSESDGYETFDDTIEGDSRPITRTIGNGTADTINWMVAAQNLLIATDTRIIAARSSNQDSPLTQDDFGLKDICSQGASRVNPVIVDNDVVYVQNTGTRLSRLFWDGGNYIHIDLSALSPEVLEPAVTCLAAQYQPDVRIHCVRSDGVAVVLLFDSDPASQHQAFIPVESTGADGLIEDAIVLPGDVEDRVYYTIKRAIPLAPFATDAGVVRFIEKFALESECQGGTLNKQLDKFILYSGSPRTLFNASTTFTTGTGIIQYFDGVTISVWGDGEYKGDFTVTNDAITLPEAISEGVFGFSYEATFKSVKLGRLMDKKTISQLGLLMRNVHPAGLEVGMDFDHMVGIPEADWGQTNGVPDGNLLIEDYHKESIPIDGTWTMDSRICLRATSPYPATVLAAIANLESNEK